MARVPKLPEDEVQARPVGLDGWSVVDGILTKKFRFKGFMDGMAFVNRVAALAEEMDHHPDIYIRFGLITISLITHAARGLTLLDFEQARKVETLYAEMMGA